MSPLTEPLSRPALPQVEGAGDFSVREYEQVAGAITASGTRIATILNLERGSPQSAIDKKVIMTFSAVQRRQGLGRLYAAGMGRHVGPDQSGEAPAAARLRRRNQRRISFLNGMPRWWPRRMRFVWLYIVRPMFSLINFVLKGI